MPVCTRAPTGVRRKPAAWKGSTRTSPRGTASRSEPLRGLDYFAIDCAETRDGRLLLFEAGTGMIVHAMDSADVFPYKQIQMQKIFRAFGDMLEKAVNC